MVGRHNADIADTLHLRDVAMATTFWLSMGYNFGCMIASGTLFDLGVDFRGQPSNYPMKTIVFARWRHLENTTERSIYGCDAA